MAVIKPARMQFKRKLKSARSKFFRRIGVLRGDRKNGLADEYAFWENALKDQGRNWSAEEFRARTDPNLELQSPLKELIDAPVGAVVRILDVGAGPLTRLGKRWEGRQLEIIPVDPLADQYDAVLKQLEIAPPVRTRLGHGERLLEDFRENSFDLAYASNSLDHSCDPIAAIGQMLAVVKAQCVVYLWHFSNVGVEADYQGLHQWNFDVQQGDLTLSDGHQKHFLSKMFAGRTLLQCEVTHAYDARVVVAKLRKLP
jgi:SAM-dependent methyltransferase